MHIPLVLKYNFASQPYPLGRLTGAYPTSLLLRPNSSLRSELHICPKRLSEMPKPAFRENRRQIEMTNNKTAQQLERGLFKDNTYSTPIIIRRCEYESRRKRFKISNHGRAS